MVESVQVRSVMFTTGQFPFKVGKFFQTRWLQYRTRWGVWLTSSRDSQQDDFQVGRAKF